MDRQERVRDTMDDIFEAKNFFRKHVARGPDSIFRAIADVLFSTQFYRDTVKAAFEEFLTTEEGVKLFDDDYVAKHKEARALAKIFNLSIQVVCSTDQHLRAFIITPDDASYAPFIQDENESDFETESTSSLNSSFLIRERFDSQDERELTRVLLCFTEPHQYDPIYHSSMIDAAGIVQSILYEVLYEKVFHQEDAYEASKIMLGDDPCKPTVYDKDFQGKPMEAINCGLIPFPYKVAKAMDPFSYRNIEYDVWVNERRAATTPPRTPKSSPSSSPRTFGTLLRGSPCYVTIAQKSFQPGFIQGPASDGRLIEVFIPCQDICIYVMKRDIMPIRNPPEEFMYLRRAPNENSRKFPPPDFARQAREINAGAITSSEDKFQDDLAVFETQIRNHSLTLYDEDWLKKFDFTIPPPVVSTPTTPVRTTFPPVTPISCAPALSGPPDLGSPLSYQPDDSNLHQENATNDPGNFMTTDLNFAQMNYTNSVQINDPTSQNQNVLQSEVYHVTTDSGFVTCTVPGCTSCNLGMVPMEGTPMLTNPQDSVNYGGMVPTSQMVPVPTGIPSQPNPALDDGFMWLPIVVNSPNPWSRSSVLPGTPLPTPHVVLSSTTYFRFDAPYVQQFTTPTATPIMSPLLGNPQQAVFLFSPTIPNQQQPGYLQQPPQ